MIVAELKQRESKATCEQLVGDLRTACMTQQGVQLCVVYLCKDHSVPITTSGKIARRWCKRAYDADSLDTIFRWQDQDAERSAAPSVGGSAALSAGVAEEQPEQQPGPGPSQDMEPASQAELDALLAQTDEQLLEQLVRDTADVINFDEQSLRDQTDVALVTLGLDSLGLAQVKGMLEYQYGCPVPDQWMYFESTTLQECVLAVRMGGITEDQADGTPLEVQQDPSGGNQLVQTCPCLLMCCPRLVLGD